MAKVKFTQIAAASGTLFALDTYGQIWVQIAGTQGWNKFPSPEHDQEPPAKTPDPATRPAG